MQKVFAGVLFTTGFIFLMVTASVMITKDPKEEDRSAALGGLMLGIPATAGGAAIVLNMRRKQKALATNQLQQLEMTFVELLHNTNGQISVVEFAVVSKLSIADSKQFLDCKASQLNGDFDVSDDGKISYQFDFR
jgi:hypothetical protein